ncbi:pyridoxamine 5'-phosphate oxidase family protein [Kineococcus sp. SYSU DK006]|uniref:pyridoxamine 5'-phosphate oxidase family protein n=1 Tax=Kineococcus sp. SYSU DK006 TaxID=3383127 RepID=UPI003D7C3FB8
MINWSDIEHFFRTEAVAHLATLGKDGGPRSVPVWISLHGDPGDSADGARRLVFFTAAGAAKDRNLVRDRRLALSITAPGQSLNMATVRGEVIERLTGADAMVLVDRISHEYTGKPYFEREGLVAFIIHPTAWWAHDFSVDEGERT